MLHSRTHNNHPVGDALKKQILFYTEELKTVNVIKKEHRFGQIRRADLFRRSGLSPSDRSAMRSSAIDEVSIAQKPTLGFVVRSAARSLVG
jgi:hypothetical protein